MLVFVFFVTCLLIYKSIKKYKILTNPFVLESYYPLIFLVLPQLVLSLLGIGENYWLSDWVILLYVLCVFLGTSLNFKTFRVIDIKRKNRISFACLIFAIIFILPTLKYLFNCGISLVGIRCYYETVVFSELASFYELGKNFLFLSILLMLLSKNRFSLIIIILILIFIFSGSKFAIFNFLIFLTIYLEVYKKVNLKVIIWASIPVFFLMIIYHFTQTKDVESPFLAALNYFDIYKNQSFLLKKFNAENYPLYYGEITFSSYLKFIPRIIWEDKPYNYGFAILNYDLFPEFAALNYMPSFGLGTLYADFGLISVMLGGFFSGLLRKFCYNLFKDSGFNSSTLILYYFSFSILTMQFLFVLFIMDTLLKSDEKTLH